MTTQSKKNIFVGILALAIPAHLCAQLEINPSISETQRAVMLKDFEAHQADLIKHRHDGVHTVIQYFGTGEYWVGVMGYTNVALYKPLPTQAFDAHLVDQDGKEVSKARFNNDFGQALKPDKKLLDG